MIVHGALLDEPLAKYPVTTTSAWVTRTIRFLGDQEQSWTVRRQLLSIQLSYVNVNGYDAARVTDFFDARVGMYVDDALLNTFKITINGVEYLYMSFDQDDVPMVEQKDRPNYFNFTLNLRQLRPS